MVFTQPPVEAVLRARAAEHPSVTVELGLEAFALTQTAQQVTLQLRSDDGQVRAVTASYVIACDGASSPIRQLLDLKLEDLGFDEPWMVVDVRVNEASLSKLPQTAAQYCDPARPTTFIVGPGNHRRWEIMLLPDENPLELESETNVWRLLSPWLTPQDGELWRASSYRFHALVAAQWRKGRVFLAGDAAHQQPPFIGQGMCQGIRDVSNLAWKLEAVLAGQADDSLLDTYAEERGRHVHTLTARIKAIGHHICERDPEAARRRDESLLEQGGGTAPTVTRQEIVPPLETGLLGDDQAEVIVRDIQIVPSDKPGDRIDASQGTPHAREYAWVVRFEVTKVLKGRFPRSELRILVHSPSRDLHVSRKGQRGVLHRDRSGTGWPYRFVPE